MAETLEVVFVEGELVTWGKRYPHEGMLHRFGPGPFEVINVMPVSEELVCNSGAHIVTIKDPEGNVQQFSCLWFDRYII